MLCSLRRLGVVSSPSLITFLFFLAKSSVSCPAMGRFVTKKDKGLRLLLVCMWVAQHFTAHIRSLEHLPPPDAGLSQSLPSSGLETPLPSQRVWAQLILTLPRM
ncbi:hypothetical protein KIL84_022886 [Mauremys mutica]|uniref:Uncharacterized protein n=1 Tax=Mauremys mutica TaxID=74926 RepID=A0A9D4ALQ9_9SAUR|nr:hypothetical protein KIL84_022886 [Mauremys mutica]